MIRRITRASLAVIAIAVTARAARGQQRDSAAKQSPTPCSDCAAWNAPHAPFKIAGNTWYVGTDGLSALLITSSAGHVLIDGALPQSAGQIAASIRALGFRVEDVKLIVNSHVHFDHAGGIAELQRLSNAQVAATAWSADVLRSGKVSRDDPQFGVLPELTPVQRVRVVADGETLHVGRIAITAHLTAGHTPGGTSWTWESCEGSRCRSLVYGDSQSAVSADGFLFTKSSAYPSALADFARGFAFFEQTKCDILVTPHPSASALWERLAKRAEGNPDALVDTGACRRYAATARERLAKRVAEEAAQR